MSYLSHCRCRAVSIHLELTGPIESYVPRACDCRFCRARDVSYLSDPKGAMVLRGEKPLVSRRQGSGQAEFLLCADCDDLVAVVCAGAAGEWLGAANARLFDRHMPLREGVSVSPRQLSPEEKLLRWREIWMNTELHCGRSEASAR